MLKASDFKLTDNIYTFVGNDGKNVHIGCAQLRDWCISSKPPVVLVPVDKPLARSFFKNNAVSKERVLELMARVLMKHEKLDPIIFCKDGTFTNDRPDVYLADGHHRYAISAIIDDPFIEAHVLDEAQWRPFQIDGLPSLSKDELRAIPIKVRRY